MKSQEMRTKSSVKELWNGFSDRFERSIIHPQYFTFKAVDRGVQAAERYAKGTLIDIGCGRMPYRGRLLPKVKRYIGVDSPVTSTLYKGKVQPDIYASSDKIPLKSGVADIVLLLQVLEYLENPEESLKEIHRLLKKNGVLIISVPFMYAIHDIPYDKVRYTESGLRLLMKSAGFTIDSFSAEGTFADFWGQALNVFILKRIKDLLPGKKSPVSLIYLAMLLAFGFPMILCTNILVYLLDEFGTLFPRYPNYFPLDYILVVKKAK